MESRRELVGVQIDTTLSCHLASSIADSVSTDDLAGVVACGLDFRVLRVSSSAASRPGPTSRVCVHE